MEVATAVPIRSFRQSPPLVAVLAVVAMGRPWQRPAGAVVVAQVATRQITSVRQAHHALGTREEMAETVPRPMPRVVVVEALQRLA